MADTPWATQDPSAASLLPDPLNTLVQSTETQLLLDCLRELQDVQRNSIVLAYFHGYTHEELARYLNAPLGTVKSWVRRGLQRIRDCLNR